MSYILDALKKAEAERRGGQRASGPIPPSFHVHAQRQPIWQRPWLWAVLSASAVVAGGLIWMGGAPAPTSQEPVQQAPETQQTQVAQAPAAAAAPPAPAAPAASSPPPAAQAPASPPPPAPSVASVPSVPSMPPAPSASTPAPPPAPAKAPEQPVQKPRPAERKPVEKKAPETPRASKKPQQEDAVAAAPSAPAPAEKAKPAPEPKVGTLRDLPARIQQEVPQYSVGGYIYSGNKADRSVVINKRLLREGDEIAPGLTLESMTPTGMVLSYKGYRYRASY